MFKNEIVFAICANIHLNLQAVKSIYMFARLQDDFIYPWRRLLSPGKRYTGTDFKAIQSILSVSGREA
jgi:hypothetical protein